MSDRLLHRVVIDPNVLISATITPRGALGPILHLIDDGTLVPVVTRHLVDEVIDVLGRPKLAKYVRPGAATAFEHQMRQSASGTPTSSARPRSLATQRTTTSSH